MVVVFVVVALCLVAALAFAGLRTFNTLIGARNRVENAWSGIDVMLRKRYDLVPQLVAVVDAYRIHEQDTLSEVAAARSTLAGDGATRRGEADLALETNLRRLYAVAEAYPTLRADAQFAELARNLTDLEDDLVGARRYYNALVRRYNDAQQTFPAALVARRLGHCEAQYFQLDAEARRI